jgi:hypothetical protein
LKLLETDGFAKLRDIVIEVGNTKSLDELCMDNFICDAVFNCFGLDQELLLHPEFPVVSHGKGTYGRTMLFFCMGLGLGLIASKTMSEAFSFRPLSVLGYAIDNNLLGAHGLSCVRVLAQKTSDDKMLDKIKRRVGQMEKAQKMKMKPKTQVSPEVVLPVDLMGVENGPAVDGMDEEEELSPDFIKRYTRLKWECLITGVSISVLQYPFPKPLLYKQLKENL